MNAIRAGLKAAPAEHESLLTRGTMHAGLENWLKPPMDVKYFHDQWKRKVERFNFLAINPLTEKKFCGITYGKKSSTSRFSLKHEGKFPGKQCNEHPKNNIYYTDDIGTRSRILVTLEAPWRYKNEFLNKYEASYN